MVHRALSVAPPTGKETPGYVEALRGAIPSVVDYVFDAIEAGEERVGPAPEAIEVQAAASARNKVGLETVLRRYAAGYSTLNDFLHQEVRGIANDSNHGHTILQRELTALFDRLIIEVTDAYRREEAKAVPSPRERQFERIRRLMAGELVDPAGLEYPLERFHVAVIISGVDSEPAAVELARELGRQMLVGECSTQRCTAWLGGARVPESCDLEAGARAIAENGLRCSFGEPGAGLVGWRRSRRQAEAAELVAERSGEKVVRYRDVALHAAALRDPDLYHFLIETYIEPLRDHPSALMPTLRALLVSGGNVSSAAAALGVARHTVSSRLRVADQLLGQSAKARTAQLETALRLADMED